MGHLTASNKLQEQLDSSTTFDNNISKERMEIIKSYQEFGYQKLKDEHDLNPNLPRILINF